MKRNYNYVLQENIYDCGLASLKTILMFYDININSNELNKIIKVGPNGTSAYNLVNASKKLGLESVGIKSDIEKINSNNLPCIAHVVKDKNLFHYIVIYEINKKTQTIKIMDPADGIKLISFEDFKDITTNIYLLFKPKNIIKIKDKRFKKFIFNIFKDNKKIIFKSIILSIIFILLSLASNYYLKIMFDNLNSKKLYLVITIIFINIYLLKNIINYYKNKIIINLSNKIDKKINKKIISHIMYLPYKYYIEKSNGELITIINDVEYFKEIIIKIFLLSTVDFILIFIVLIYISCFNIYYFVLLLFLMFVVLIITKKYKYIFNDNYVSLRSSKIKYNSNLIDSINSFNTIKGLNIEDKIISKNNKLYKNILENSKKYQRSYEKYNFITNTLIELIYLIVILISSLFVIKLTNSSNIILFSSLFYLVINFFNEITNSLSMSKIYATSVNKVLDLLSIEKEIINKNDTTSINKIEYKNLSYITDKPILNKINVLFSKNDKIFITGKSGIGKSTMMKLLLRYYEYSEGDIFIDGINIKDLDIGFIRNNITYVSQNETLFTDTILNNLSLIKNKDIYKVLDIVNFDKKIPLSLILEDNGINLSGGERKKIIIARALLKSNNILIFDESFNEIDINEEKIILNNIFKNYPNLTIIMISHRNDNIHLFDKVYKLDKEGFNEKIK